MRKRISSLSARAVSAIRTEGAGGSHPGPNIHSQICSEIDGVQGVGLVGGPAGAAATLGARIRLPAFMHPLMTPASVSVIPQLYSQSGPQIIVVIQQKFRVAIRILEGSEILKVLEGSSSKSRRFKEGRESFRETGSGNSSSLSLP